MSAKHVPGPWKFAPVGEVDFRKPESEDFMIVDADMCCIGTLWGFAWKHGEPNARLIAAAPDLLEALSDADKQMETAGDCIEAGRYDEALLHVRSMARVRRTAIAKARGEA